ncbi:hypothetical protein [Microbacterium phyllosphaerae]|uniref:hypothetical protein n=1 Tax=Microbacterium phyllosphaerae TaxID=124798 RepID=UPI002169084F|nr:hypothetical protein [Microbacterium phyllosphaerae]MCS3442178.1 chitodextrinase [Microbacterium phyllosphaerae]
MTAPEESVSISAGFSYKVREITETSISVAHSAAPTGWGPISHGYLSVVPGEPQGLADLGGGVATWRNLSPGTTYEFQFHFMALSGRWISTNPESFTTKGNPAPVPAVITSAKAVSSDGIIEISGTAEPGAQIKTTKDPSIGWWGSEWGVVLADKNGKFTMRTKRLINGDAVVRAFGKTFPVSAAKAPTPYLESVTYDKKKGYKVVGWAQPGAEIKSTNDRSIGWYSFESGVVRANAQGRFEGWTKRKPAGNYTIMSFGSEHLESNGRSPAAISLP